MRNVRINGHEYDIRLFVFDKDGLMFESRQFWIELAQARVRAVEQNCPRIPGHTVEGWMTFVGASWTTEHGFLEVTDVDPTGILAVAPVPEEIISSAAYFADHLHMDWIRSREMVRDIFERGDRLFDLASSLKPRPGFPDILCRLREANIPYGVATSDTRERVEQSLDLFDSHKYLKFIVTLDDVERGKPYPDMLQLIQNKTRIPMEQIAMLGDSFVDVEMARAAGALGIGIPEQESMRQRMSGIADEIITSLDEILIKNGKECGI